MQMQKSQRDTQKFRSKIDAVIKLLPSVIAVDSTALGFRSLLDRDAAQRAVRWFLNRDCAQWLALWFFDGNSA